MMVDDEKRRKNKEIRWFIDVSTVYYDVDDFKMMIVVEINITVQ